MTRPPAQELVASTWQSPGPLTPWLELTTKPLRPRTATEHRSAIKHMRLGHPVPITHLRYPTCALPHYRAFRGEDANHLGLFLGSFPIISS